MKIVINGGRDKFSLTKEVAHILGVETYEDSYVIRTNPALIKMLENGDKINNLKVVEIPNHAADYMVVKYDDTERVIFVVNNKLHRV